jgi:3-deoxy-D-manno-octulosonic-acid transferase/heptosyltransferase-1
MDREELETVNILLVKLSAIGDVIHTLPALAALRRCYPDADITWVVEEAAADLLSGHPDLNRILVSRRKTWMKDLRRGRILAPLREMHAFLRELRGRHYDLVIDFHGLLKSAVIVLFSGGKRKLGYDSLQEGSGLFYNEKIPEKMGKHAVDRYLDFVSYLSGGGRNDGETACPAAAPEFTLIIGKEERRRVAFLLQGQAEILNIADKGGEGAQSGGRGKSKGRFVAVNPVAFWETKLWEDKKFADLCDRIRRELGIGVILTGDEDGPLDRVRALMKTEAVNLGGKTTLRELAFLYSEAALVITTDTGPMHLAAAVGTPVVALFGPTDPARTGPYGPGHRIIRSGLDCMPCFRKQCETKSCMKEIAVEEVFAATKEMLTREGVTDGNQ